MQARFQAFMCSHCGLPHYDVWDTVSEKWVEDTKARFHGGWHDGFGDTPEAAIADANRSSDFASGATIYTQWQWKVPERAYPVVFYGKGTERPGPVPADAMAVQASPACHSCGGRCVERGGGGHGNSGNGPDVWFSNESRWVCLDCGADNGVCKPSRILINGEEARGIMVSAAIAMWK